MICYFCCEKIEKNEKVAEGLHVACFTKWFGVDPQKFSNLVARSPVSVAGEFEKVASSFFHGKFRKYSANLGGREFILKVRQEELPELPAMEYLCNQIARALKLKIPNFYFIRLEGKLATFVVDNFMQDYPGGNLVHIYRYLKKPEQFTCKGLIDVIEKVIGRRTDIEHFVELCLFDALIGNHDRHGRNMGIIESSDEITLAPFYDNPSYIGLEIPELLLAYHEPRGAIPTSQSKEPTMKDYVMEFQKLGFDKAINRFKSKIMMDEIESLISDSFICEERQQALLRLIKRRYQELIDAS